MADYSTVKISSLPVATSVTDNDSMLIVQGRVAKTVKPSLMKGPTGASGESAYLRYSGDWVQWKLGINGSWQNLVPVADFTGPSAYEIARKHGYTGTEAEWVASLSKASEEAAEVALQAARTANETNQTVSQNEALRVEAENGRVSAENTRIENETTRQSQETTRSEAETARIQAEAARAEAESGRSSAESSRITAEQKRQEDTDAALERADQATGRLNELSDNREYIGDDGYWYRYNEETKEFENTGKISKGNVMYATFSYNDGRLYMRTRTEYEGPMFRMDTNGRLKVNIKKNGYTNDKYNSRNRYR